MRATGIAFWETARTQSTASRRVGKAHTAADIASGVGWTRKRDLADEAERALRADEQPREVIARRGLARARARADHLAVRGDDHEREDVLAHRAVADGRRARRAGGDHPAEGGVGAGIDGEEHALRAQHLVELLAGDAGLDRDVEVVDRQAQDAVHLAHVDADPALQRRDVPLERRSRAEGDDRRAMAGADADDRRGLLGARRVDDGVGGGEGVKGLVDAVLVEHVAPGEHAVGAEQRRAGRRAAARWRRRRGAGVALRSRWPRGIWDHTRGRAREGAGERDRSPAPPVPDCSAKGSRSRSP